jgi:hypothetical protein
VINVIVYGQIINIDQHSINMYFIGIFGNLSVEIAAALRLTLELDGRCTPIYKKPFYIFIRAMFALFVAGPLPIILDAPSWFSAAYIGASAPVVMDRLASGAFGIKASGGHSAVQPPN